MKFSLTSHISRILAGAMAFGAACTLLVGLLFVCTNTAFADTDEMSAQVDPQADVQADAQADPQVDSQVDPQTDAQGSAITDEELASALSAAGLDPEGDEDTGYSAWYLEDTLTAIDEGDAEDTASLDASSRVSVSTYAGADRYATSAKEALGGWSSSNLAIITTGENWVDALAISGLAGALSCPVLLTRSDSLPTDIANALVDLGVTRVIIVGGTSAVSTSVESELGTLGITVSKRLGGSDRYGTQLAIYEYGVSNDLWPDGSYAMVVSGAEGGFADALSIAPLAYALDSPIFIVNGDGALSTAQNKAFNAGAVAGTISRVIIAGGTARISTATEASLNCMVSGTVTRLAGENRYETSAKVASWATSNSYLTWNNAAFTTGAVPYDALGGGALQGTRGAVMLLVDDGYTSDAANVVRNRDITSISFFGGTNAISQQTRNAMVVAVGGSYVIQTAYDITLSRAASIEGKVSPYNEKKDFLASMDPSKFDSSSASYLQFAILSGYTGLISIDEMNAYIEKMVVYSEANYGVTSTLRGQGSAIINAAKENDINEFYLLAHAALESAWGCSDLAQGDIEDYEGYYNFFGIGAYDSDPNNAGAAMAKQQGWSTPAKALSGAAKWITNNYISGSLYPDSGAQNTLFKMRYDLKRMANSGDCWHQYATSITWAQSIARVMCGIYEYAGYGVQDAGLVFDIPSYA